MNSKNRKEQLKKMIKEAELRQALATAEEQTADDNAAGQNYGQAFHNSLVDAIKIPGLEDDE